MEDKNQAPKARKYRMRSECPICSEEVNNYKLVISHNIILDKCQSSTLWGDILLFL